MAHQTAGAMWENGPRVGWFWCLVAWTSSFSLENLAFQPHGYYESRLLEAPVSSTNPFAFPRVELLAHRRRLLTSLAGARSWGVIPRLAGSFAVQAWLVPKQPKTSADQSNLTGWGLSITRSDATSWGEAVTFDQDISHVQPKFYLTASHFATSATFLGQRTHLLNYVARKYFPSYLAQTSWHIPCMILEVRVRGSHRHDCLLIRFFDISVIKFPLMEFRPTHDTARIMPSVLSPEASLCFCSTQIYFFFSNDVTSASEWNTFQTGPEKAMSV